MANTLTKDRIVSFDPGQAFVPDQPFRAPAAAWTQTVTTTVSGRTPVVNTPASTGSFNWINYGAPAKVVGPNGQVSATVDMTKVFYTNPATQSGGEPYTYTTTKTINHPADPGQPYIQGKAYRPPSTTVSFNLGWNAGARSLDSIPAGQPGGYEFQVGLTVIGAVVGLNRLDTTRDYTDIGWGIYFERGAFKVMELGAVVASTSGTYLATDVFRVQRNPAGKFQYLKNNAVIYASAAPAFAGEVFLDTSLFSANDFVDSPKRIDASDFGAANVSLLPLTSFAIDAAAYGRAFANMQPLVVTAAGDFANRARVALQPLTGLASDAPYGTSSTAMQPLASSSSGKNLIQPDFSIADVSMMALHAGFTYGSAPYVPSTSMNYMMPLVALGSDAPYGMSSTSMFPIIGWASDPLPEVQDLRIPMPTLRASGSASNSRMVGAIPALTLVAFAGATAARGLQLPRPTLTASGTVQNAGTARLKIPSPLLTASASGGTVGNAQLTAPGWKLSAYAGAVLSVDVSRQLTPTLTASTTMGTVGNAKLTLPLFSLTASGTNDEGGMANLLIPAPKMVQGAVAYLVAPGFTLTAIGQATVALAYEAYAVNLKHTNEEQPDQVTRYTRFAFDCIVRYQGSYFGMNSQGLFLLEGPTDHALPLPLPIPAAVRTGITDFKSSEKKTVVSAYFAGRMGPDATVTLYAGESGDEAYAFTTPRGEAIQNHRQKLGRGVKNRYFALGVATDGALELDGIEPLVEKLTRRI